MAPARCDHAGMTDTSDPPAPESDAELRTRLLGETARARWSALERFFAQGVLLAVATDLDLIEVGVTLARDDAATFEAWMRDGRVGPVSDAQARAWQADDQLLWAMVIKPWVLVQERRSSAAAQ